jgi:hypothetical protein
VGVSSASALLLTDADTTVLHVSTLIEKSPPVG